MSERERLTPERIQELRRIAEAATPGPWAWRMSKDGRILDLITLETGYNAEIITPSHISAWLKVKGGLKDFIPAFDPATALALLDRIEALERQLERAIDVAVNAALTMAVEDTGQMGLWALHDTAVQQAKERLEGGATHA